MGWECNFPKGAHFSARMGCFRGRWTVAGWVICYYIFSLLIPSHADCVTILVNKSCSFVCLLQIRDIIIFSVILIIMCFTYGVVVYSLENKGTVRELQLSSLLELPVNGFWLLLGNQPSNLPLSISFTLMLVFVSSYPFALTSSPFPPSSKIYEYFLEYGHNLPITIFTHSFSGLINLFSFLTAIVIKTRMSANFVCVNVYRLVCDCPFESLNSCESNVIQVTMQMRTTLT